MLFENLLNEINQYLDDIIVYFDLDKGDISYEITEPPRKELGDLSSNIAFIMAKKMKKSPIEISKAIVERISSQISAKKQSETLIKLVSYENPGFINFKTNEEFLKKFFSNTENINYQFTFAQSNRNKGFILIEHTSVNPNKSLHVGHLRNAIIGDCLYRILNILKENVIVLNYIDDSGLQVADIIVALKYAGFSSTEDEYLSKGFKKFDQYCGSNLYVKINELYLHRPDLVEKRKYILKELENPDSEIYAYTNKIVNKVLKDQLETCWRLKCHYDVLNFESQIVQSKLWNETFQIMKDKKIIYYEDKGKNAGCWIYKSETEGDKVVVRSDSTLTYFAKDIPYALWKLGYTKNPFDFEIFSTQWDSKKVFRTTLYSKKEDESFLPNSKKIIDFQDIDKVITIIDFRQERLQKILIEVLEKIGVENIKYNYLGYEPVNLSNNSLRILGLNTSDKKITQMSGRKGIFIEADAALDQLEIKSKEEIRKRNADMSEDEVERIAKEIAVSAIRYFFIKIDKEKMITFDINDSLSLDGDTGPYIQYTHARGNKILDKISRGQIKQNTTNAISENDLSTIEIDLIKHLCKYSLEVTSSAKNLDPKIIAKYLYYLATLFNNFYEKSPIMNEKNEKIRDIRISILKKSIDIMRQAMYLIGITPLERM